MNSRRDFLKHASCAVVGSTTLLNTVFNLRAIGAEAKFNSSLAVDGDYKALVCLTMGGGNDSMNMVVPNTTEGYEEYLTSRTNLAVDKNQLLPLNPINGASGDFGLHPACTNMQSLFNNGDLGIMSNIGSLIEPIESKEDYYNGINPNPLGLFSHSDMIKHWQTALPQERSNKGWAGKIADLLIAANDNTTISMNISLDGSNVFQTGDGSSEYSVHPINGATPFSGYNQNNNVNTVRSAAVDNLIEATYSDIFEKTYMNTIKVAKEGQLQFAAALAEVPDFATVFSDNDLSQAFHMVSKIIAAREILGMSRQIFFLKIGGWDHHDDLIADHALKLGIVDTALGEFKSALDEIQMFEKVTTFSVSEFARKLTTNGDGSDHAWGGNAFVMGGDVVGQTMYGTYPSLSLDGDRTINNGVLIPTTSCDEYFAELALWYGVPSSSLVDIFPNLGSFYTPMTGVAPIGFLPV